jgi:3-oxosteroid 1-dehydrogenase
MAGLDVDLLVVGGGAAGLLAAIAARRLGDRVLVVEETALAGGATLTGDGALWLPGNQLGGKAGEDSPEAASDYLDALLGEPADAGSAQRRAAFVRTAPKLAKWLASSNVPLHPSRSLGDAYPALPGFRAHGRVLRVGPIDRRLLADFEDALTPEVGLVRTTLSRLPLPRRTTGAGESLVAHLLHRATANGVDVWLNARAAALLTADDRVTGATVAREDGETTVTAKRVLLAAGGFGRSQTLREEYLPLPTDASWSISSPANDGAALDLAAPLGAASAELDEAWWTPVMVTGGQAYPLTAALADPHGILVDAAGDRFTDETGPAHQVARAMYEHSRGVRAVPSWLVMDNRHRQGCQLGPWAPGSTPKQAIEDGDVVRATTLNDLAMVTGIDRAGLLGSAVRFNGFAAKGNDLDFGRGEPSRDAKGKRRNASLGKLDKPPFWAVRVYPGDTGTKGGLVVDANSRVLRRDGSEISGLYACPGSAASIFTGAPPAPGAALAESLVAAFLAVTDQRQ